MGNCLQSANKNIVEPIKKGKKQPKSQSVIQPPKQFGLSLLMKCWKQTHNNLFNYKLPADKYQVQTATIMLKKVRVVKLGTEYQSLLPNDEQFKNVRPPVMIDIRRLKEKDQHGEKKFSFLFDDFPKISKPFWLVVKSLPSQRYLLKEGDVFKMGKTKLRVKQIIHQNDEVKQIDREINSEFKIYDYNGQYCEGVQATQSQVCRICMDEGQNQNPLISLCDCSGGSKYTHYKCLKKWFTTQLNPTKVNMLTQITWKILQCQFCKAKMPYCVNIDNDYYFLITFPKMKKPYLVLNPVYKNSSEKSSSYFFISFKKVNRMTIGRSVDAQIQLCVDSTLSRSHSVIEYVHSKDEKQNGKFYLSDNNSKFGTVVLLKTKNEIKVEAKMNNVEFQVGGDTIKICYKVKHAFQYMTKQDQIDFNASSEEYQDKQIEEEDEEQMDKISEKPSQDEQISKHQIKTDTQIIE